MSAGDLDLFVIGGGSGGVRAARIAAGHGARVALAEEYRLGGTCVIRGCVPKKLFVLASRFADDMADAAGFGWSIGDVRFDWPTLRAAKDKEVARLEVAYGQTLAKAGVETLATRAVLIDPHTVRLSDGTTRRARHILIATGAAPVRPSFSGADLAITSNEIFDLPTLPARILIVGGGYIAVEFACLLQRLGVAVTVAYRGDMILRGFDVDLRARLTEAMVRSGIEVATRTDVSAIRRGADDLAVTLTTGETRSFGQVMLATGRAPYTQGLGLDAAGVAVNAAGAIIVDERSQTSTPSIHAVGDVTNRLNLTPVAIREGHAFADSMFGHKTWAADHKDVATAVFSTPELGTVGLSEDAARATHSKVDIYKTAFRSMRATLSGSEERTFMKLVVCGSSDRVLGVHILGEGAGEMAQLLGIAVKMNATKADFDATMPVHPTAAEELVTLRTKAG
ncbi:MAG: glutathione-disulfide reductase [Labrys sp. (in: a-proteobacteria)]|jgi:glutathione reductase (NADPH)